MNFPDNLVKNAFFTGNRQKTAGKSIQSWAQSHNFQRECNQMQQASSHLHFRQYIGFFGVITGKTVK